MPYIIIIFLPLISFININLFGFFIGYFGCCFFLGVVVQVLLLSCVYIIFYFITTFNTVFLDLGVWFSSGNLVSNFSFVFDSLSISMLFLIILVSSIVILFSMDYMITDPFLTKFLSYLTLFSFFMIILVTSTNMATLLAG